MTDAARERRYVDSFSEQTKAMLQKAAARTQDSGRRDIDTEQLLRVLPDSEAVQAARLVTLRRRTGNRKIMACESPHPQRFCAVTCTAMSPAGYPRRCARNRPRGHGPAGKMPVLSQPARMGFSGLVPPISPA
ncbi:hypothetical protein [Paracoccus aminovorans]|uniref:hypothetical protein n=1 Tax=Paracoccus aminovorans TaxID=34004 RepID=UPI000944C513|nr:hypothetical protein [Paracoccus aminovorans]